MRMWEKMSLFSEVQKLRTRKKGRIWMKLCIKIIWKRCAYRRKNTEYIPIEQQIIREEQRRGKWRLWISIIIGEINIKFLRSAVPKFLNGPLT